MLRVCVGGDWDAEGAGQRIASALVLILAADRTGSPASLRINTSAHSLTHLLLLWDLSGWIRSR